MCDTSMEYQNTVWMLCQVGLMLERNKNSWTLSQSLDVVALCHQLLPSARLTVKYDTTGEFQWDREPLEGVIGREPYPE